ncbi:hypothetical protein SISNIDRAFT_460693 [Sistotremastrum niveocremeum HHB9708]|uniref:NAD(P)-binding protein n=2 Tax=Sistotremastraceae TaxID=3402574 RepID=A0A164NE82_9AGAM|nr:hypothetical protein SISNIDRAFT_460693 [Sistotremastrum niveocremeum HHB9708]KZT34499.1 hypothetical protein SISSUDRAFT_1052678 [Sistotremastrum suecicum HHB10207 ss-3]
MGRACALNFARAGCKLVLTDINESGLNQTIKQAQSQSQLEVAVGVNKDVVGGVIDIKNSGELVQLIEDIPKRFGRLDYAV